MSVIGYVFVSGAWAYVTSFIHKDGFLLYLTVKVFPSSANCTRQVLRIRDTTSGEVSRRNLGINLHLGVLGHKRVRNGHTLQDLDASIYDRVMFLSWTSSTNGRISRVSERDPGGIRISFEKRCPTYHVGHGQEAVNLGYTEPMKDIGHHGLEPHVLVLKKDKMVVNKGASGVFSTEGLEHRSSNTLTPATSSVRVKYWAAVSPMRFRAL